MPRRISRCVLLLPPGWFWPVTGWPRGFTRRMCAPTGQRSPFGSPDPSAFTYSKLFICSSGIPSGGLSVSGDNARGTPLRQRPQIFEASKATIQAEFSGLWDEVTLGIVAQDEKPGFAWLLVIRRIALGTAANRGHADA